MQQVVIIVTYLRVYNKFKKLEIFENFVSHVI